MSTKLPVVRGADLVRALERTGWTQLRTKGSHVRMEREGHHVSIPLHNPLRRGTLATILDDVGMTADELRRPALSPDVFPSQSHRSTSAQHAHASVIALGIALTEGLL